MIIFIISIVLTYFV